MEGIWFSKCPCCGFFMTKKDPLDPYRCRVCGWQETTATPRRSDVDHPEPPVKRVNAG